MDFKDKQLSPIFPVSPVVDVLQQDTIYEMFFGDYAGQSEVWGDSWSPLPLRSPLLLRRSVGYRQNWLLEISWLQGLVI